MANPELSIIIPALNEADTLPLLFADLAGQQDVAFEVIIVDGGSDDKTVSLANSWLGSSQTTGSCIVSDRGRGKQLNAGINSAKAEWLLLLHADSRLPDQEQLRSALDYMVSQIDACCSESIAGRFHLKFDDEYHSKSFALYYCEIKARLGREESIHGDQGMLLKRSFFQRIGPFREDLTVMEDTSLAETIRKEGQWCLMPGEIITSSRRFLTEGITERQTLNALMMNFRAIGWLEFFVKAPDIYRQQAHLTRLQLKPFFELIRSLLNGMPIKQRWRLWYATGTYVRRQAWQIGLFLDCRKAYRQKDSAPELYWVEWFDRWFEPLTDHFVGNLLTAVLVRFWFVFQ